MWQVFAPPIREHPRKCPSWIGLKPTCFKGLLPSAIDLLLINNIQSFIKSNVYETGFSDDQEMIISVLRKTFTKGKPKTVFYRCYRNFDEDSLNETLNSRISLPNLSFKTFFEIFQSTLSLFAPYNLLKKIRYNNNPFMTKRLRKEIMIRLILRPKFNESRTKAKE